MKIRDVFLILAVFVCCIVAGFLYTFHPKTKESIQETAQTEMVHTAKQDAKITKDTKMIYQYYYAQDRITKEQEEVAQEFLWGLSRKQVESIYDGWQMVFFSPKQVILRSTIDGRSDENYLLGIHDDNLAVFRETDAKKVILEEVTDIPIATLPSADIQQLRDGVRILGESNLAKVLADYKS